MGDDSKIEWTDASWNPVTGCDRTSPGCDNCYALGVAKRMKAMGQPSYQNDGDPRTSGPGFGVTWVRDLRDRSIAVGGAPNRKEGADREAGAPEPGSVWTPPAVAFFFKQWGAWSPIDDDHNGTISRWVGPDGATYATPGTLADGRELMSHFGKKAAGRLLDHRTWDEYPQGMPRPVMTDHLHRSVVEGCYRCELGKDECVPVCPDCDGEGGGMYGGTWGRCESCNGTGRSS